LVSASTSSALADLRNEIREQGITFLQQQYPDSLPRLPGSNTFPFTSPLDKKA
jgi:hypothetical protein